MGFRGLKARVDGKTVDAVAIYMGGRTGPEAAEGKEIVGLVPLDENLPDLVAKLIQCLDPEAGAPHDQPPVLAEATATDQQALVDAPPPGDSSRLEMP